MNIVDDEARYRARADELWEALGRPEGPHPQHWEQALVERRRFDEQTLAPQAVMDEAGDAGSLDTKTRTMPS